MVRSSSVPVPLAVLAVAVVALFASLAGSGCASDPGPKPDPDSPSLPPPELDAVYEGDGFTIQPPRDWQVGKSRVDWVVRAPRTHVEFVNAVAKLVLAFEQFPEGGRVTSLAEFRDVVLAALESQQGAEGSTNYELKILDVQTTEGTGNRYIVDVTLEVKREQGIARHRILAEYSPHYSTTGFWRASASAWKGYWDRVSPLLLESLRTVRFTDAPDGGRDLPPSMRED